MRALVILIIVVAVAYVIDLKSQHRLANAIVRMVADVM